MRIAIVSEINLHNANYGNRLQAYALNHYLNSINGIKAESILFSIYDKKKITKLIPIKYMRKVSNKIKLILKNNSYNPEKRIQLANTFTKKYTKLSCTMNWKSFNESNYDYYVVGSDVVWAQTKGEVNRIRFLDLKRKNIIKIAYAASFGSNEIPKENIKYIRRYLNEFKYISVRESNSIDLLKNIGVTDVKHVCDPTLLLSKEQWESLEKPYIIKEKYIFVYLLGKDEKQRNYIKKLALNNKLKIVTIPNANEVYSNVDDSFGDYKLDDCSPEEWLYLIHNADYIFTDSFHCLIFSTIFKKKFFVLPRISNININNRLEDYLNIIGQKDKLLLDSSILNIQNIQWNYNFINKILNSLINYSKKQLNSVFKGD